MPDKEWMNISDEERLAGVLTIAVDAYITQFPPPNPNPKKTSTLQ